MGGWGATWGIDAPPQTHIYALEAKLVPHYENKLTKNIRPTDIL